MDKYKWTGEADKVIFEMITVGASVADICDRMGCTDTQLKNHVAVLRRKDPSFPTLCGEVSGKERFVLASAENAAVLSGKPEQIMVEPADGGSVELIEEPTETEEKKGKLNPLEKEMAGIIAENKKTIEDLRRELSVEKEARAEEGKAYRDEIGRLKEAVRAKDEEMDKLVAYFERKKVGESGVVSRLENMVRERNEVIYQIAKSIYLPEGGLAE